MKTRGVLTARSIFEFHLKQAGYELKSASSAKALDVTSTCNKIGEMIEQKKPPDDSQYYTKILYNIAIQCSCKDKKILSRLYGKLSDNVHGYPWHGSTVMIYAADLSDKDKCILTGLCGRMNVEAQLTMIAPV
jgi:hypothetical protein